jgi:hypothetical protein
LKLLIKLKQINLAVRMNTNRKLRFSKRDDDDGDDDEQICKNIWPKQIKN